MQTAKARLHEFESTIDEENFMLLVTTNGTVSDITKVLSQLENAVTVAEFALKQPTLEDVFLSIIGEDKNNEEAV
jgi:ABC-type uncharacterized transport system ATPase subunit